MPSDDDIPYINRAHLKWDNKDLLGEGSFGRVFRGQLHGTPVAIKVVKRAIQSTDASPAEDQQQEELAALKQHRREIHRFKVVQNPHIIQYLGVFRDKDPHDLYIVTEYLEGGSLHDSLESMRARSALLHDRSFLQIARHIAYGLNHVHSERYTHGDVKPQNILLSSKFQYTRDDYGGYVAYIAESAKVKIADFGLSKRLNGARSSNLYASTTGTGTIDFGPGPCGTLLYMSPEGYRGIRTLDDSEVKAADIYAYGLVLYELLTGLQSWQLERVVTPVQLIALVTDGQRPSWGDNRDSIHPRYIQLVESCWSQACEDRPTAEQIINILNELHDEYEQELANAAAAAPNSPVSESQSAQHDNVETVQPIPNPSYECDPYEPSDPNTESDTVAEQIAQPQQQASQQVRSPHSDAAQQSPRKPFEPPMLEGALMVEQELNAVQANYNKPEQHPIMNSEYDESRNDGDYDQSAIQRNESQVKVTPDDVRDAVRHVESLRIVESDELPPNVGAAPHSRPNQQFLDSGSDYDDYLGDLSAGMEYMSHNNIGAGNAGQTGQTGQTGRTHEEFPGSIRVQSVEAKQAKSGEPNRQREEPAGARDVAEGHTFEWGDNSSNSSFPMPEIHKVDSEQIIKKPSIRLGLPTQDAECATYGVPLNGEIGKRSQTVMMNSFIRAAVKPGADNYPVNSHAMDPQHAVGLPMQITGANPNPNANNRNRLMGLEEFAKPAVKPPTPQLHVSAAFANAPANNGIDANGWVGFHGSANGVEQIMGAYQNIPDMATSSTVVPPLNNANPRFKIPANQPYDQAYLDMLDQESSSDTNSNQAIGRPVVQQSNSHVNGQHMNPMIGATLVPGPAVTTGGFQTTTQFPSHVGGLAGMDRVNDRMGARPMHARMGIPSMPLALSVVGMPRMDENVVEMALQHPDGLPFLASMWQNGQHQHRTVASGLSKCRKLQGEHMLDFVCQLLQSNMDLPENRRDRFVVRDLCTVIGNVGRNDGFKIEKETMLNAIRSTISSLSLFPYHSDVYAACTYALSNLFKINNKVNDLGSPGLQQTVATWIVHCIMWNVSEGNNSRAPKWDVLALTSSAAARNFMWMNEANVATFINESQVGMTSSITHIINTILLFDYIGPKNVVETSLSALAMIVQYPTHTANFAQQGGLECVSRMLKRYAMTDAPIVRLTLCMLTMTLSAPVASDEATDVVSQAFVEGQCAQQMMQAMEIIRQQSAALDHRHLLETLESGFSATLAGLEHSTMVERSLTEAGVGKVLVSVLADLVQAGHTLGRPVPKSVVELRRNLAAILCKVVVALCRDSNLLNHFHDARVDHLVGELRDGQTSCDAVAQSCRSALAGLGVYA